MFFDHLLKKLNQTSDMATDGETGLEKVAQRILLVNQGKAKIYELIIIDYNMPQMPGTEVATRICSLYEEALL